MNILFGKLEEKQMGKSIIGATLFKKKLFFFFQLHFQHSHHFDESKCFQLNAIPIANDIHIYIVIVMILIQCNAINLQNKFHLETLDIDLSNMLMY